MKLNKITIKNFRCFENLTIGFEEDVNVIVGINGAGKTALLDAIRLALEMVAFPSYPPYANGNEHARIGFEYSTFLTIDDVYIDPNSKDSFSGRKKQVLLSVEGIEGQKPFGSSRAFHVDEMGNLNASMSPIQTGLASTWSRAIDPETVLPLFVYYLARRKFLETPTLGDIFNVKLERPTAFLNALEAGTDYQAMCQWFYIRENAEYRERIARKEMDFEYPDLKAVRGVLYQVVEDVERIYFDQAAPPKLMVDVRKNGVVEHQSLNQLSDGYRNQLAMIMDFARRLAVANPYMENPLEAPGILLIDEIELHLHPKWQQTVIPSLRKAFPNTQLIVTTHSPQVLTTVENRCIRLLKDNKVYTTDEFTMGAESKRVLEHILGTDSRPPDSEIGKALEKIFDLIDKDELDEAERELQKIDYLKTYETSLLEAESLIACKRWEREEGI